MSERAIYITELPGMRFAPEDQDFAAPADGPVDDLISKASAGLLYAHHPDHESPSFLSPENYLIERVFRRFGLSGPFVPATRRLSEAEKIVARARRKVLAAERKETVRAPKATQAPKPRRWFATSRPLRIETATGQILRVNCLQPTDGYGRDFESWWRVIHHWWNVGVADDEQEET